MRIAVLDDEPPQREYVIHALSRHLRLGDERLTCAEFRTGEALRRALRHETFDLLVLDWNLPGLSGAELLRWLRELARSPMPVLMLSSRASERDVAAALGLGADDYVIKPFRALELCARVQRLLPQSRPKRDDHCHRFGDWVLDASSATLVYGPPDAAAATIAPLSLSEREFRLALTLFRNHGKVVSREHLMEGSGYDAESMTRQLDGLVFRLRHKLTQHAPGGLRMQTIYGQGYRLAIAAES